MDLQWIRYSKVNNYTFKGSAPHKQKDIQGIPGDLKHRKIAIQEIRNSNVDRNLKGLETHRLLGF